MALLLDDVRNEPTRRGDGRRAQKVRVEQGFVRVAPHVRAQGRDDDAEEHEQPNLRDLPAAVLDVGSGEGPLGVQPRADLFPADFVSQVFQGDRHGRFPLPLRISELWRPFLERRREVSPAARMGSRAAPRPQVPGLPLRYDLKARAHEKGGYHQWR